MPLFNPIEAFKKLNQLLDKGASDAEVTKHLENYTQPQLGQINAVMQEYKKLTLGSKKNIPDDPASFAEVWSRKINPNNPWIRAKHLDLISDYLQDLYTGKRKRVIVAVAPRRGKSSLCSIWQVAWRLAKNPSARIGLISYSAELAERWSWEVRNFIRDYGSELGVTLDSTSTAKHNWSTTAGGNVRAVGRGGATSGFGFDLIIVDDILKNSEEASSDVIKNDTWEWWVSVILARTEPQTAFCLIGTRWSFDDLQGRLEQLSDSGEGQKWDILRLPEIAEKGDPLGRAEGEVLWPERFSPELVAEVKKGTPGYFWSALYQQSPVPVEGGLFQFSWWQYYKVLPEEFDLMIQSWDLSFKDLKTSDYAVGQVWGRKGARFYLVDQIRKQMNAKDIIEAIKAFSLKYPKARAKLIEDKANGPAVIAMLQHEVGGLIPVKVKVGKEQRAQAVQPYVQAGNCFLPDPSIAPWVNDFTIELAQFPHGSHDDQLDTFTQAINYLAPGGWMLDRAQDKALALNQTEKPNYEQEHRNMVKKAINDIRMAKYREEKASKGPGWNW